MRNTLTAILTAATLSSCATMPKDPEYYVDPADPMYEEMTKGQKRIPFIDRCEDFFYRITFPKVNPRDEFVETPNISPQDAKYKSINEFITQKYN